MSRIRHWLKEYRWIWLLSLGFIALSAVLVVAHQQSPPTPIAATASPTTAPVVPLPSIAPSATASLPVPAASTPPKPSPKAAPPATRNPGGKPQLTPAEQALNQRAKAQFLASAGTVDSVIEIHVAVVEGVSALNLAVSSAAVLFDQQGKALGEMEANLPYTVQTNGTSILVGSSQFPSVVQVDPGPNGGVQIGDRTYRGRLVLVVNKGGIWAVNHVNLRKYLHSVVASEVSPNWNMNALKAQAIAARSYALTYYFRPVSDFYHLGDDEYYQVYSGIAREAPETNQAVDATAGEFVSYRGGIVESLYAASDDIVAEAFQGKGMSQLGASDLADRGYAYEQILSHYYPGTGVGRIVLDHE